MVAAQIVAGPYAIAENATFNLLSRLACQLDQVAQAKRNTEKAKDLEGMDMGNVVLGSRRRGRSDTPDPPQQKRRRVHAKDEGASSDGGDSGESDSGGEESGSSSNEDSESEFEFSG